MDQRIAELEEQLIDIQEQRARLAVLEAERARQEEEDIMNR